MMSFWRRRLLHYRTTIQWTHFLVASAKVYGLTLVTADTNLLASKACPFLANR